MRTARNLLVLAAFLAVPWALARALGWDAELSVISNGAPIDAAAAMHASAAVVARLAFALVAPMFALGALVRGLALLVERWTAPPAERTLRP